MMEHYVTLFDSFFLPQGLALHSSMERHLSPYTLWILCVNDQAHDVLTILGLPNVRLLKLSDLETADLLRVKSTRTKAEYCWTLTPFAPRFVFESDPDICRVTYVDADLWFRRSPREIFQELELSGKSVLITEHAYAPEYDQSATSGRYCVQFMTFYRDVGESVRKWWEERCIEWCYARAEDGKFGDQKYLDDWAVRFGDVVHVLKQREFTLAPWNASRFPYADSILYHFHGLRICANNKVWINSGGYLLPRPVLLNVYKPYLSDVRNAVASLSIAGFSSCSQLTGNLTYMRLITFLKDVLISLRSKKIARIMGY